MAVTIRLLRLVSLALMALLVLLSLLPSGVPSAAANGGNARIRAVHAVPNFGLVDVYVDGAAVLEDVSFFTVSDYLELAPDTYLFQIIPAGEDVDDPSVFIANRNITLAADTDYSLVARGIAGEASLGASLRTDNNSAPALGKARVRVAHFSPDVHDVDVFLNGQKVADRLTGNQLTPYLSVDPGTYTVEVAVTGEDEPFFTGNLTVSAGTVVTAWANGLKNSQGANRFAVTPTIDATSEPARVRAVHAVPDIAGSPVDVYVDDAKVVTFDFFDVTDYLPIAAGTYTVRVVLAGGNPDTEAVITAPVTIAGGKDYSIIARGTGGNFGATVLEDNNERPTLGQARVRAAHFSPDAPAVDVYVNGALTIQDLTYPTATGYLSVPAGDYTLGIAPANGAVIYTATATLEAGQVVTVWANGLLGGSGAQAFKLTPSVDAEFESARVRAVHAVPDIAGSPVDVYVDDAKVVTFDFFDVTDYLPIYAGTYTVRVVLAGGNPDTEAVITAPVTIAGGKDYSIIARGTGGNFGATVLEDNNERPTLGQARVRAAHFSPDAPAVDVYVNGALTIQDLTFPTATGYLSVPAGDYTLGIAPANGAVIYTATATLEAGQVVTVWANGLLGGSGAQAFKLTPSVDAEFESARVRAVHAVPDIAGSPVDVYVDDAKVVTFDFFDVTDYLPIAAGTYTVRVVLAGGNPDTEAVITAPVTIAGGKDYSIIARGTGGNFGATVLEDNNERPTLGQARVRAAHFSPDAPAVDVYVNGALTIQDLTYPTATGYLSVPAGDYTLGIAPANGAVIYTATATLEAGQVVTVWANGLLGGSGAQAFKLTPSVDAEYEVAQVRLLHAVPDAPAVDIYVGGERVVQNLAFGSISNYLSIYAGEYEVEIRPAGGSTAVFEGSINLAGGRSYTAVALGLLNGTPALNVALFDDTLTLSNAARGRLRIIQLSPDASALNVVVESEQGVRSLRLSSVATSSLSFGESSVQELDAGTYQLRILNGEEQLLTSRPILAAGQGNTIFVLGKVSADAPAAQSIRLVTTGETATEVVPQNNFKVYLPIVIK
jgi:trimeric autotransporter adhesin